MCVVVAYGLTEGDEGEMKRFWSNLGSILKKVGRGYRLCRSGDVNRWVRDRAKEDITGAFGKREVGEKLGEKVQSDCCECEFTSLKFKSLLVSFFNV